MPLIGDRLKKMYHVHERRITTVAFLAGFVWDNFTLTRVDLWLDNLIITFYLLVASASIILFNLHASGRLRYRVADRVTPLLPLVLQFGFGGLFSGFLVFYSRSASLAASWPFLLFLTALLIGNERFRERYARFVFQIGILFIALFSYAIFFVPVLVRDMGWDVFLLSGVCSIGAVTMLLIGIGRIQPALIRDNRSKLVATIAGIYLAFHALYFTNILPPIPLSLKEIGVYHSVTWANGTYAVLVEPAPWYAFFERKGRAFSRVGNAPVFAYSAIFAPTKLKTQVLHRWSHYNEMKNMWEVKDTLGFFIVGGRDGGYRGYTMKRNVDSGQWRVDVITKQGQVLGRIKFRVVARSSLPALTTEFH